MVDCHIHTKKFSEDASLDILSVIDFYKNKNIKITTTEHLEISSNIALYDNFNKEEYFKYKDLGVFTGVEVGFFEENKDYINNFISDKRFDFILLSKHTFGNKDIFNFMKNSNLNKEELLNLYFEDLYKGMHLIEFDSLAHIDFLTRYTDVKNLYYEKNKEILDKIFLFLIKNDKSLEINLKVMKEGEYFNSINEIFKAYSNLGGKFVTIGSDSHHIHQLESRFDLAFEILKNNNLKACYYENRKEF